MSHGRVLQLKNTDVEVRDGRRRSPKQQSPSRLDLST